jgi:hypothetical protein
MTQTPIRALAAWALLLSIALAAVSGCASVPEGTSVSDKAPAVQATAPTDLSPALRCMDTLLLDYGARDLSVIVEGFADPAPRTGDAKDVLIATVSDMTQRSRAIRLIASGKDWGNTARYMAQTANRESTTVVPQYALRGTVTAFDAAGTAAVDLNLLATRDMSVVPGAATRASIVRSGSGAEIRKFGIGYGVSATDRGQALRALVDVAAIELFGRLARVPYWTCLGATAAHASVAAEIQDWYDAMAAHPGEIIKYFQAQLRLRHVYDGPIDGAVSPQFKEAVARFRELLGLAREAKLSLDFFRAYLGADHRQLEARLAATAAPKAPAKTEAAPLALQIAAADDAHRFTRGEAVRLTIRLSRDAHVYCFLQDEERRISRFFPNRFQRDSRVRAADGLQLPGAMRFEIQMNARGVPETVACFATERDILAQLPAGVNGGDFDALPVATLDQVRDAFAQAAGGLLAQQSFALQPR